MWKSPGVIVCILLLASGVGAQEVYVDNVVIVLDASGSMNETMKSSGIQKINAAKTAIKEVMKTIPQTTQVGLLVFGGEAHGWVYPLGVRDDAKLLPAIDRVSAGGGTPLGAHMKIGADRLLQARKAQYGYGSYRLLVVTDGEANDAALVEAYTPDIMSRGIITDVIGVDMGRAHTLATKVHSYRRANDPAALRQAIQEIFAEVGKTEDGTSAESAFEELEGFPEEGAMAVISALVSSGNYPIGGHPEGESNTAVAQDHATAGHPSVPPPPPPSSGKQRSGFRWILIIVVVMGVSIFLSMKKRGRRR